jgi:hypothetical protein
VKSRLALVAAIALAGCASSPPLSQRALLDQAGGADLPLPTITTVSAEKMDNSAGRLIPGITSFYWRGTGAVFVSDRCAARDDCDVFQAHELYNYARDAHHLAVDDCAAYVFAADYADSVGKHVSARNELDAAAASHCAVPSRVHDVYEAADWTRWWFSHEKPFVR